MIVSYPQQILLSPQLIERAIPIPREPHYPADKIAHLILILFNLSVA
jgi:hypothetical protein